MKKIMNVKSLIVICLSVLVLSCIIVMIALTGNQSVTIGDDKYDCLTKNVVISNPAFTEYEDYSFLKEFTDLETLDLRGLDVSIEKYNTICSNLDQKTAVLWDVPFDNSKYPCDVEELSIPENTFDAEKEALSYFKNLKKVKAAGYSSVEKLNEMVQAVKENNPDAAFECDTVFYGVPVNSSMDFLCLNNIPVDNVDSLRTVIDLFPNITSYEMCDCGISDDVMGQLREDYPEIKFTWMLYILKYRIRTDVQCFSTLVTLNWSYTGDENTFSPIFKYCTELRALDLGHWDIRDISAIRNLKKLQVLIFYGCKIEDITPLGELTDLMYIDLRRNNISDVSPLTNLQKLEYLAIGNNPLKNAELLVACKKMERLHISSVGLPTKTVVALEKGLPKGCEFKHSSNIEDKWTGGKKESDYKHPFFYWKKVKEYHRYDDVIYYSPDEEVYW